MLYRTRDISIRFKAVYNIYIYIYILRRKKIVYIILIVEKTRP